MMAKKLMMIMTIMSMVEILADAIDGGDEAEDDNYEISMVLILADGFEGDEADDGNCDDGNGNDCG